MYHLMQDVHLFKIKIRSCEPYCRLHQHHQSIIPFFFTFRSHMFQKILSVQCLAYKQHKKGLGKKGQGWMFKIIHFGQFFCPFKCTVAYQVNSLPTMDGWATSGYWTVYTLINNKTLKDWYLWRHFPRVLTPQPADLNFLRSLLCPNMDSWAFTDSSGFVSISPMSFTWERSTMFWTGIWHEWNWPNINEKFS